MQSLNYLGFGLGLRPCQYEDILSTKPAIDWFEIVTEDYLVPGGNPHYYLTRIRENYPIVMHGVSLSIASCDPLDWEYLKQVKDLAERIKPEWISDHLCWTGINGINLHDLLPVPYTQEALQHVAERVLQVQDYFGRELVLENPSTYITFKQDQMSEWEFFTALVKATDCKILLDINNVYVSAFNHGFDPMTYFNNIPSKAVQQFHLAGHSNFGTHIIDTHDDEIIEPVWDLYAKATKHFEKVSTLIERDEDIPALAVMIEELEYAKRVANQS